MIGKHLQHFWKFIFLHAQKYHYFYFWFKIRCHYHSQPHRFSNKVLKFWLFDKLQLIFGHVLLDMHRNSDFRASGYNSDNAVGLTDLDSHMSQKF